MVGLIVGLFVAFLVFLKVSHDQTFSEEVTLDFPQSVKPLWLPR